MKESKAISILILLFIMQISVGCISKEWRNAEIISPDKKDTITIITIDNDRYIIPGSHSKVPKSNFAKIDISKVDPIGDEIGICWGERGYRWELVSAYGVRYQNKIDTSKYRVFKKLSVDNNGNPTFSPFDNKENCVSVMIRENKVHPVENATILYK